MECRSFGVLGAKNPALPRWVRIFAGKSAGCLASQARHEMGAPVELFAGAKRGREKSVEVRIVSQKCAKFHESPRKFAQIRAVVTRCYALLRVGPSGAWNQCGEIGVVEYW